MANWKGGKKGKGPDGPEEVFPVFFLRNHDGAINQIILQNNTLVTTSSDGKITIWDYSKRSIVHEFRGDSKRLVLRGNLLYCCSFGVFGNQPGVVSVYDIQRKAFIATYKGHSLFITDMILSDNSLYTSSADHTIRVWDPWVGDSNAVPGDFDAKVNAVEEKKTKKVLYGHSGVVNCLLLNDRGVLFSGSADNTIKIWTSQGGNTVTLTNTMSLVGHTGAVNALEFANNTLYSGGADDSVRVWNPLTGQCSATVKLKSPLGLIRHDDSLFVQHTTEHAVTQVNLKSNKVTRKFEGHTGKINVVKFSLHHMYTGSDDGSVRRWNLKRGTCSTLFKGHKDKVHSILLDLPMMLSGSTDTTTCIWEILRNEDETQDEIAEEEADWKKRKENEAREAAAQLAMQSSPPPPTVARQNSPAAIVVTPASTSTPQPASAPASPAPSTAASASGSGSSSSLGGGGGGDGGIDWMSALTMTQNEKAPPKKSTKKTVTSSSSARSISAKDEGSASEKSDKSKGSSSSPLSAVKRGGLLGLVRSASEAKMSDRDREREPPRSPVVTPASPPVQPAQPVYVHAPPATTTALPASTSNTRFDTAAPTFADRSETSVSDDGSESSGMRGGDGYPGARSKIMHTGGAATMGAHKAQPAPRDEPIDALGAPEQRRALPFTTWKEFLDLCGLEEYAEQYETLFRSNAIELDQVPDFNNDVLKELKIKMGHIMKMMKVVNSLKP